MLRSTTTWWTHPQDSSRVSAAAASAGLVWRQRVKRSHLQRTQRQAAKAAEATQRGTGENEAKSAKKGLSGSERAKRRSRRGMTHCCARWRSAERRSAPASRCRAATGAETLAVALSWRVAAAQRSARVARARQPPQRRVHAARCLGAKGQAHAPGRCGLSAGVGRCSHARPQQARDGGRESARRGARRAAAAGVRSGRERGASCTPTMNFAGTPRTRGSRPAGVRRRRGSCVCGSAAAAACSIAACASPIHCHLPAMARWTAGADDAGRAASPDAHYDAVRACCAALQRCGGRNWRCGSQCARAQAVAHCRWRLCNAPLRSPLRRRVTAPRASALLRRRRQRLRPCPPLLYHRGLHRLARCRRRARRARRAAPQRPARAS